MIITKISIKTAATEWRTPVSAASSSSRLWSDSLHHLYQTVSMSWEPVDAPRTYRQQQTGLTQQTEYTQQCIVPDIECVLSYHSVRHQSVSLEWLNNRSFSSCVINVTVSINRRQSSTLCKHSVFQQQHSTSLLTELSLAWTRKTFRPGFQLQINLPLTSIK